VRERASASVPDPKGAPAHVNPVRFPHPNLNHSISTEVRREERVLNRKLALREVAPFMCSEVNRSERYLPFLGLRGGVSLRVFQHPREGKL